MRGELRWRSAFGQALGVWAATRVGLALFTAFHGLFSATDRVPVTLGSLADGWVQWDARWYLEISHDLYFRATVQGPVFCPCDPTSATRFFPLYPLLVRAVGMVLGGNLVLGGLVVSNLALLAALTAVALILQQESPGRSPAVGLLLVVAYPLAFVLATAFSEALFLALAAFCLLFSRRGQWRQAAALAFLAALTRPSAAVLLLPMAWEFVRQNRLWERLRGGGARLQRRLLLDGALLAIALPAGYAVFMVFLASRFGDPLVGERAHAVFNDQHLTPPWQTMVLMLQGLDRAAPEWLAMRAVDLGAVVAVLLVTLAALRRSPPAFSMFSLGLVLLHLSIPSLNFFGGDVLASSGRYLTAAVPVFVVLGQRLEPRSAWVTLLVSSGFLLQAALLVRYLGGGYVA